MRLNIKHLRLVLAGLAAVAAALAAAQAPGERSGEEIVKMQCIKCHGTGAYGAPRIDDRAAWAPRMHNGLDATVRSAIRGHGSMPARGGMADLTDSELRSAILYMFNPSGAKTKPLQPSEASLPNHVVVDGTDVFLGVTSAKTLRAQHPHPDAESRMHGGIPSGDDYYHVNISLRDAQTGAVIHDARVEASVSDPVMGAETRKLEPVTLEGAPSYGNYFRLSGNLPHTITVRVHRPGWTHVIEAKFDFKG